MKRRTRLWTFDEADSLDNLSVDQATRMYESSSAEVFKVQNQTLKILKPTTSPVLADLEIEKTKLIGCTDLQISRILKHGSFQGRRAILKQWIEGSSLEEHLLRQPLSLYRIAKGMARFHRRIHSQVIAELPKFSDPLKHRLKQDILHCTDITSVQKHALEILERMPDANCLCHGDFNFENIIISPKGWHAIDWTYSSRGDPLAEVAQTWLRIRVGAESICKKGLRGLLYRFGMILFGQIYLMEYFKDYRDRTTYPQWVYIVAVSMLSEDLDLKPKKLLMQLTRVLSRQSCIYAFVPSI